MYMHLLRLHEGILVLFEHLRSHEHANIQDDQTCL